MTPLNPIVEALVRRLDGNLREAFEERAGIMQFEAGQPRELAEALALLDVIRLHPLSASGVAALQVQLDGAALTILTTTTALALQHLSEIGAEAVRPTEDLAECVRRMGIAAVLTHLG